MWKHLKRHKIASIFLCILAIILYMVLGAIAPFVHYRKISDETKDQIDIVNEVYNRENSVDRAKLLESNLSAWEDRVRLFHMAKERIILSTFDMREGNSTTDLASILLKKADEGVKISILVDGMNGQYRMRKNNFFFAISSHPNIEIRFYNPINLLTPWTSQGRMHDKYIIVDEYAYILGGRNTFDYFIGDYPTRGKSYDREVLIYNTKYKTQEMESSLYQLEAYFNSVWNSKYCESFSNDESLRENDKVKEQIIRLDKHYKQLLEEKPEYFSDYDYEKDTVETDSVTLISGEIGIYGKEPKVLYQLEQLMLQAKDRVVIHTPYAVCNGYMYSVLENVASKVPDVTMMVNSIENGDNFVASSDYRINKGKLLDTKISLYEYDGGTSYHGKSIVIDDTISIVGSYNYDLRSTYMDTELMVAISSKNLTKSLSEYMENMEKDCRKVIGKTEYQVPDHLKIEEMDTKKDLVMKVFGHVAQLFRYLI
ncbi:MAG: phospholipase D-like domain-containing protein [bacterium]|nr:phospholipase D-like domain-containing protein [bacterium]